MISVSLPARFIEAVPPDVEDATAAAIAARNAQLEQVSESVLARLTTLSQAILAQVSIFIADRLVPRLPELTSTLARLTSRWTTEVTATVQAAQVEAVAVGQALVDSRLLAARVEVFAPEVSLTLMNTLQDFSADLIDGLSQDLLKRVNTQLRLGAMGQIDAEAMIRSISNIVPPHTQARTGAAARAEAIGITEVGRVHSMASWQRLQEALRVRPDLMKQWLHSGLTRNPRSGHQAISRTVLPVAQPFQVSPIVGSPSEPMLYPRVATASARNTVRCRCVVLPYLPEWTTV